MPAAYGVAEGHSMMLPLRAEVFPARVFQLMAPLAKIPCADVTAVATRVWSSSWVVCTGAAAARSARPLSSVLEWVDHLPVPGTPKWCASGTCTVVR